MDKLKSYFTGIGFDSLASEKIAECFQLKIFEKGAYFVTEGKMAPQIDFVADGQFQYYATTRQGEETTAYVALKNSFIQSCLMAGFPAGRFSNFATNTCKLSSTIVI